METRDDKNPMGEPSDAAAAHNVPEPHDEKLPTSPQPPATPAPDHEIRYSSSGARNVVKRGMNPPGCWVQGGTLEPFASVAWELSDLARLRGVATNSNTGEVDKIRAARIGKESKVWIHPTDRLDPEGTEVTRAKDGSMRISLFNFLAKENLIVAVRRRERFNLETVTDGRSPVGPALLLDFSKPLETKVIPPRKKKSKSEQGKSGDKKAPELKKPEPETEPNDEEE